MSAFHFVTDVPPRFLCHLLQLSSSDYTRLVTGLWAKTKTVEEQELPALYVKVNALMTQGDLLTPAAPSSTSAAPRLNGEAVLAALSKIKTLYDCMAKMSKTMRMPLETRLEKTIRKIMAELELPSLQRDLDQKLDQITRSADRINQVSNELLGGVTFFVKCAEEENEARKNALCSLGRARVLASKLAEVSEEKAREIARHERISQGVLNTFLKSMPNEFAKTFGPSNTVRYLLGRSLFLVDFLKSHNSLLENWLQEMVEHNHSPPDLQILTDSHHSPSALDQALVSLGDEKLVNLFLPHLPALFRIRGWNLVLIAIVKTMAQDQTSVSLPIPKQLKEKTLDTLQEVQKTLKEATPSITLELPDAESPISDFQNFAQHLWKTLGQMPKKAQPKQKPRPLKQEAPESNLIEILKRGAAPNTIANKVGNAIQTIASPFARVFNWSAKKAQGLYFDETNHNLMRQYLENRCGKGRVASASLQLSRLEAIFNWAGRIPVVCICTAPWRVVAGLIIMAVAPLFGVGILLFSKEKNASLIGRAYIKETFLEQGLANVVRGYIEGSSWLLCILTLLPLDLAGRRCCYVGEKISTLHLIPSIEWALAKARRKQLPHKIIATAH